jgi:hypothetical protein
MHLTALVAAICSSVCVLVAALACSGNESEVTETPLATLRRTQPTGMVGVDTTIEDVLSGDARALAAHMDLQGVPCVDVEQVGSPPVCPDGVKPGTPVEVFPISICEGSWVGAGGMVARLETLIQTDIELFAVVRSTEDGEFIYRTVFRHGEGRGFWLTLRDDMILEIGGPCTPIDESTLDALGGEIIFAPGSRS